MSRAGSPIPLSPGGRWVLTAFAGFVAVAVALRVTTALGGDVVFAVATVAGLALSVASALLRRRL
jgi:hypothetical protein